LRTSVDGVSMVHGGWHDPIDEYLYDVPRDYFAAIDGTGFASGHTHMQGVWAFDPKVYCNPGSVGQPRDGDPRAAYGVLDDEARDVTLFRVPYPVDQAQEKILAAGLPASLANRLALGR
jgi:diadenosine tetraphosphatase ApaH/serine/threonine PP2A family protein phosphatase